MLHKKTKCPIADPNIIVNLIPAQPIIHELLTRAFDYSRAGSLTSLVGIN